MGQSVKRSSDEYDKGNYQNNVVALFLLYLIYTVVAQSENTGLCAANVFF